MNNETTPGNVRLNAGLGRSPERDDFDAWAVCAGFADRAWDGRVLFHRCGGDGMWEAYCAGAGDQRGRDAIAGRDYLNTILMDLQPIPATGTECPSGKPDTSAPLA